MKSQSPSGSAAMQSRRRLLLAAAGAAASTVTAPLRAQQAWPSRPIQLVVPLAPGGAGDVVARACAKVLSTRLGQQVVVENRLGAGGNIGVQYVSRAKPDGYTLVFGATGPFSVNPTLFKNLEYDPVKSFEPVSMLCRYNNVLVAHPSFPATDVAGFIAEIRNNPDKYNYVIPVIGNSGHLTMEMLKSAAKLNMQGIPYKGAAEAMTDFLSGRVPLIVDTVVNQLQYIRSDRVKAFAVTALQRSHVLPNVPTVAESGFPGFEAVGWGGIFAPAGTPADILTRLSDGIRQTINDPAYGDLVKSGLEMFATSPDETRKYLVSEIAKWRNVIQAARIKLD